MNVVDMRLRDLKDQDKTYDNILTYLLYKSFDILYMHNDFREDDSDDGGYCISISKKEEKYYVHVIEANYNSKCSSIIADADDPRLDPEHDEFREEAYADYVAYDTVEDCIKYIKEFVELLDVFLLLDDFEGRDPEDFLEYDKRIPKQTAEFLATCFFPYSEFPEQEREELLNIKLN